jgi:steroid delta-isomerase-like uncharacterized protein
MYMKCLAIPMILALLIVGCSSAPSEQLEANKELVHRFTEATNTADWDAFDELLTENFCRHSEATGDVQVNSREDFKKLQKSFLTSMPDQKITLEMLIAEGDKVAVYAMYSGTMTGPMGEFPATGKFSSSPFLGIFRIEDAQIAELWIEWDNLAMLGQLGLFPPPDKGNK